MGKVMMVALVALAVFAVGLWTGFEESGLTSITAAHSGTETIVSGGATLTDFEAALKRQQTVIDGLIKAQTNQQEALRVTAEATAAAAATAAAQAAAQAAATAAAQKAATAADGKAARSLAAEVARQREALAAATRREEAVLAALSKQQEREQEREQKREQERGQQREQQQAALAALQERSLDAKRRAEENEAEAAKRAQKEKEAARRTSLRAYPARSGGSGGAGGGAVGHSQGGKGWEPAVVAHTLENVIKAAAKTRQLLKDRYGEELFAELFRLDGEVAYSGRFRAKSAGQATPVFLDPKSRDLLAKRFLAKLAGAQPKVFTMAFGGHSSAAAHGNYYNQSYAHAAARLLAPAFEAAGIKLELRNHATGGLGCVPSAFCTSNVYGSDLDAISWDFGMTDGRNLDHSELYFRQAILQQHRESEGSMPPPLLFLAHNSDPQREEMLLTYKDAGFEVAGIRMNQAMNRVPKTSSSGHAATLPDALRYLDCTSDVSNDECKAHKFNCLQLCGDEVGAACHGQVSWHPGWRYHQLKGDLIALPFLEALSDAAVQYQTNTMELGPVLAPEAFQVPAFPEGRPLPSPWQCGVPAAGSTVDPMLCDVPLRCATTFEPRRGPSTVDLRLGVDPGQGGKAAAAAAAAGAGAKGGGGGNGVKWASGGPGGWKVQLAPGEGDNAAACTGHLDQKYNVLSGGNGKEEGQWLTLKVPEVEHGVLILCEGPFSARSAKEVGYLNTSVPGGNARLELREAGKEMEKGTGGGGGGSFAATHYRRKLPKSLCSVVREFGELPPGDHVLRLRATKDARALTGFSHLIWA